jgi:hypothetical protein
MPRSASCDLDSRNPYRPPSAPVGQPDEERRPGWLGPASLVVVAIVVAIPLLFLFGAMLVGLVVLFRPLQDASGIPATVLVCLVILVALLMVLAVVRLVLRSERRR